MTKSDTRPPNAPRMLLRTEANGECWVQSRLDLEQRLATFGEIGNGFATLERVSGDFLQAAGSAEEGFVVEYRGGPDGLHWQSISEHISTPEVIELFVSYFEGTRAWSVAVMWRRLDGLDHSARQTGWGAWFPRALLVAGVALLCGAAYAGLRARDAVAHLGRAQGQWVSSRDCGKGSACVLVGYTVDGTAHVVGARVRKEMLRRGPPVVVFDTRDPRSAWVGGPEAVWYRCVGLGGVGGILVLQVGWSLRRKWSAGAGTHLPVERRRPFER